MHICCTLFDFFLHKSIVRCYDFFFFFLPVLLHFRAPKVVLNAIDSLKPADIYRAYARL